MSDQTLGANVWPVPVLFCSGLTAELLSVSLDQLVGARAATRNLPKSEGRRKIRNVPPRLCSRRRAAIAPFQISLRGRGAANRAASLASVRRPVSFPSSPAVAHISCLRVKATTKYSSHLETK